MNYKLLLTAAVLTNGGKLIISDYAIAKASKKTKLYRTNDPINRCIVFTTDENECNNNQIKNKAQVV